MSEPSHHREAELNAILGAVVTMVDLFLCPASFGSQQHRAKPHVQERTSTKREGVI